MKKYSDYEFASVPMATDNLLIETVNNLFKNNTIDYVLETGTFIGLGSTTILANAIIESGKKFPKFITVEVDLEVHKKARQNLKKFKFIECVWGLSVNRNEAKEFIKNDDAIINHSKYSNIFIDDVEDPVNFYISEIEGKLAQAQFGESLLKRIFAKFTRVNANKFEENIFSTLIPQIKNSVPLFLLDSAGGLGYLEFKKVNELMCNNPYFLILDDIHHLKHFRSYEEIQNNNDYTIINGNIEQGWVVAKYQKK